jgi:SH3-like domain-containing protein
MPSKPLAALTFLGVLLSGPTWAASDASRVVVQDPYLEFHSGPGRGYPVLQVVERGDSVELVRRRTDWIKVRTDKGREGWVHRDQLERTLTPAGEAVEVPGPTPENRVDHRWEVGLATGDFDGASVVSATAAYGLTRTLQLRMDASHLLGDYSNGWLVTAGISHVFAPQWRISPFVSLGGGVVHVAPKSTIVQPEDRTDSTAYAGIGLRGYLTNRFLLQLEYRSFVVFTSRDDNEEIKEWTVGFNYFF